MLDAAAVMLKKNFIETTFLDDDQAFLLKDKKYLLIGKAVCFVCIYVLAKQISFHSFRFSSIYNIFPVVENAKSKIYSIKNLQCA